MEVLTQSTITCPACGFEHAETMPLDACQIEYHCAHCGEVMRPASGDCCVYCTYGSVPCPPIQIERHEAEMKG
ncbi:MAG: GDCCVxC domain-containing (seleno)protein [Thermomicrobiales bacterium]